MTEHKNMTGHQERQLRREGNSPGHRAFHQVYIIKDLGSERNDDLKAFMEKSITEFKGRTVDKHGIPLMLFARQQDAHKFANELGARLNIRKEHITVKARKFTR